MSDIMRPISFDKLMDWALSEYQAQGTIFGVNALYRHEGGKTLPIFGEKIETPFGPAAGPHTQLAQNLIAAYAGGARFFEVKTVQIIDGEDLPVEKPCILAEDECYNVEWSTELRVGQAFEEYVKAYYAIKLLSRALGLGDSDGFVFNMSVGYDLAGIQSPKIDRYIEGMKQADASDAWRACAKWAGENLARLPGVDQAFLDAIDPRVCKSITISTLHGCPPDEIERIATYLINEKHLNTYIKCNPTLLGYEFARSTMDEMGYDYLVFDDHHFKNDLQFEDAVPMMRRLLALAQQQGVEFGVKLTNTFPVKIARGELPGGEMYMSGKSLYPLSIALAARIARTFEGKIRISYSGGADYFNIDQIYRAGIWPITLATTLLKPGGYNRLKPMAEKLSALEYKPFDGVNVQAVEQLAQNARKDVHHVKPVKPVPVRTLPKQVPLIDCFTASCRETCPIHQDIPTYLKLVNEGKYLEALRVICEKNPLPFITGTICSHRCQTACTRNFYEEPLAIRAAKLVAAQNGYADYLGELAPRKARDERVAVVGGGPAGMAAAFLLARDGAQVTLFDERDHLGGIVRHVIPDFRISDEAIDNDAAMLEKLGVEIRLNTRVDSAEALLGAGYTHVILAIGAWSHGSLRLEKGQAMNVLDFLLARKKAPDSLNLGQNVVVIGGGNTAMDAARSAKRAKGVKHVRLVYRRTQREMPADAEELELAIQDGVQFMELLAPVSLEEGQLLCDKMALGAPDASGRRSPVATGERVKIDCDTLISAIGERVDAKFLSGNGVTLNARSLPESLEVNQRLFVVGDALRGPATVVEAIADAAAAVRAITGLEAPDAPLNEDTALLKARRQYLCHCQEPRDEANRCLGCELVCENCVDVCPNRANIALRVPGMAREQIIHIDKMCNECGNCRVFCPYDSAPYKDKFTLFDSLEDFADSENAGFVVLDKAAQLVKIRFAGQEYESVLTQDGRTYPPLVALMRTVIQDAPWCL